MNGFNRHSAARSAAGHSPRQLRVELDSGVAIAVIVCIIFIAVPTVSSLGVCRRVHHLVEAYKDQAPGLALSPRVGSV